MAKPPKKYSNLSIREKNFIKKKLGIDTFQDVDITIFKRLKEEMNYLGASPQSFTERLPL